MQVYIWEEYTLTLEYSGIGQWGKSRVAYVLTKAGDTDAEYFEGYTPRQWEFSQNEAEDLRQWGYSLVCPDCGTVRPKGWEGVDWENDPPAWAMGQDPSRCEFCGSDL